MTDINQLPRRQRFDEVQRKKAQRHLVNAAGVAGLGLAAMKGAPYLVAGASRAARAARVPVGRNQARIARAVNGRRWNATGNAVGGAAGLLGAGSTLTWGASLGREIQHDEKKLRAQNLAKADGSWKQYVSDNARTGHAYLKRGERDKKALGALPYFAGTGGAWRAVRHNSKPGLLMAAGSAALLPSAKRQWAEANRWRDKARKIEARGRERQAMAGEDFMLGKALGFKSLQQAFKGRAIPGADRLGNRAKRAQIVRAQTALHTSYRSRVPGRPVGPVSALDEYQSAVRRPRVGGPGRQIPGGYKDASEFGGQLFQGGRAVPQRASFGKAWDPLKWGAVRQSRRGLKHSDALISNASEQAAKTRLRADIAAADGLSQMAQFNSPVTMAQGRKSLNQARFLRDTASRIDDIGVQRSFRRYEQQLNHSRNVRSSVKRTTGTAAGSSLAGTAAYAAHKRTRQPAGGVSKARRRRDPEVAELMRLERLSPYQDAMEQARSRDGDSAYDQLRTPNRRLNSRQRRRVKRAASRTLGMKQSPFDVNKSLSEISADPRGVSKAMPLRGLRVKPLTAPIKRASNVRRGTFVRTPLGQTTYRRGSL